MKQNLLLGFFILFTFIKCLASGGSVDISGGGHGVRVGNEIHLLDLVEAGDVISIRSPIYHDYNYTSLDQLTWLSSSTRRELEARIDFLREKNPVLSTLILKGFWFYQWSFVSEELINIPMTDSPVTVSATLLASRTPQTIYIQKKGWDLMPPSHQAALLIHEILAALKSDDAPELRTRQLVGALFTSKNWSSLPISIVSSMNSYWPSAAKFKIALSYTTGLSISSNFVTNWALPNEDGDSSAVFLRSPFTFPMEVLLFPFAVVSTNQGNLNPIFLDQNFKFLDICRIPKGKKLKLQTFEIYAWEPYLSLDESTIVNKPKLSVILYKKPVHFSKFKNDGSCSEQQISNGAWIDRWLQF